MRLDTAVTNGLLIFTCLVLFHCKSTHARTSKSKRERTTRNKGRSTTTPKSLLDIPQNDIYNNKVEEELNVPVLPVTRPYTFEEQSRISWIGLNNNEKSNSKKRNQEDKIILQRGPPGPRGPAGAVMTTEDITKEFKKMIKSAANKRARKIIKAQCPSCDLKVLDKEVLSFFYPGVEDKIRTVNRMPMAFTTKLLQKVDIYPQKSVQLRKFQLMGSEHSLLRGVPADMGMNGQFSVDKTGIYQFTVTLNFHSGHKVALNQRSNYVQVLICPNGQCTPSQSSKNPTVTQYIHSMDSRQRYFTVQLTAVLQLSKSDYVSIEVKNACRRMIDIQPGSLMTGIILSV